MNARRQCTLLLVLLLVSSCGSRRDYSATPFFSESAFRKVQPGLNEEAVRGLLGYPVSRFGPVEVPGSGSKITWNYSVPASCKPPLNFRSFTVTFGPAGLVSGALTCEAGWEESDGVSDSIQAVQQCRRRIGDLVLSRPDGSTNVLCASQPGLYLLLLDGDGADRPRLNPGPSWLVAALPGLLRGRTIAGVKHLYRGHLSRKYGELVGGMPAETARECYLDADPEIALTTWDKDSHLILYKAGAIWSVPGITSDNGELTAQDQEWLVRRLAEPAGAAGSSPPIVQ